MAVGGLKVWRFCVELVVIQLLVVMLLVVLAYGGCEAFARAFAQHVADMSFV